MFAHQSNFQSTLKLGESWDQYRNYMFEKCNEYTVFFRVQNDLKSKHFSLNSHAERHSYANVFDYNLY